MGLLMYTTSATNIVDSQRRRAEIVWHNELVCSDEYGPKLLEDPSKYIDAEIRARIEWVKQRQNHRLTPLSKKFLGNYLAKLKTVTILDYPRNSITAVQQHEGAMVVHRLLIEVPRYEIEEFMYRSRQMIQYRLLGRYSVYSAQIFGMETTEVDDWAVVKLSLRRQLGEFWTRIQEVIRGEQAQIERCKAQGAEVPLSETRFWIFKT